MLTAVLVVSDKVRFIQHGLSRTVSNRPVCIQSLPRRGIVLPATISESLLLEAQEKRQSIVLSSMDVAELDEIAAVAMRSIV